MRSGSSPERRERTPGDPQAKVSQRHPGRRPGRLSVVSLGPGGRSYIIPEALGALLSAEVVLGYKTYLQLISDLLEGKQVVSSGMRKELERCDHAIALAVEGKRVALVSSGDAGIYGMAGLVLDLCCRKGLTVARPKNGNDAEEDLELEIIPGVPAFNAAASLVGAPLMHDFAAVSLSDHLTPWEWIEKRLMAAASADFVLALYNPRSKTRPDLLETATNILLKYRGPQTPVAIVRRAMREGEQVLLTSLGSIPFEEVDMQTMVIVGNSRTYVWRGWMITPRGYLDKYLSQES
ncbi:MAG: precorrin-3B C(17)-methyltransferase [Deltaproteobacteria bacterium]|nr:precorrin-3B C(17)-methyltransferase [Deltaproteobacteria bacterium]